MKQITGSASKDERQCGCAVERGKYVCMQYDTPGVVCQKPPRDSRTLTFEQWWAQYVFKPDHLQNMMTERQKAAMEAGWNAAVKHAERSEIATPFQLIKDAQDMLIRQNGCYPLPYDKGKGPLLALLKRLDAALEGAPNSVLGLRDERPRST